MRVYTETNSQPSIFFTSAFSLLLRSHNEKEENLIKFLLLSESRVDQFITACSQLLFSPIWENSISSVSIIVANTFSFHLCFLLSHKESQKCFFMLHKLIELISSLFSLTFMKEQKKNQIIQLICAALKSF